MCTDVDLHVVVQTTARAVRGDGCTHPQKGQEYCGCLASGGGCRCSGCPCPGPHLGDLRGRATEDKTEGRNKGQEIKKT